MTKLYNESSQLRVRMAILESQVKTTESKVNYLKLSNKQLKSAIKSLVNPRSLPS